MFQETVARPLNLHQNPHGDLEDLDNNRCYDLKIVKPQTFIIMLSLDLFPGTKEIIVYCLSI